MIIKDIMSDAMRLVGRSDVAEMLTEGSEDDSVKAIKHMMFFSFKAVVDELARGYFPIRTKEDMYSADGKFYFDRFSRKPIKIIRVLVGKIKVEWKLFAQYIEVDLPEVTVEYEYSPDILSEDEDFTYPDYAVSERLITYGMAAEYDLINGELESASVWEEKYRTEIDRLLALRTVSERVPMRRWL